MWILIIMIILLIIAKKNIQITLFITVVHIQYIINSKLYKVWSVLHSTFCKPIKTTQYTPIKLCANTADSSENPKHASNKSISKNVNSLDPIGQRKSVSIWITQNNSSHYEHYSTHNCNETSKHLNDEHTHIKQMYAAAKIAGVMLTIADIKTNWLSGTICWSLHPNPMEFV